MKNQCKCIVSEEIKPSTDSCFIPITGPNTISVNLKLSKAAYELFCRHVEMHGGTVEEAMQNILEEDNGG